MEEAKSDAVSVEEGVWHSTHIPSLRVQLLGDGGTKTALRHAFTVDVEDWQQSVYDNSLPVSLRFVTGVRRIINLLARHSARATFFVLGNVAEAAPSLIKELARMGHEIQTHGYDHTEIHRLTPKQFRQDILRAKGILQDLLGLPITGYRAPRFSIDHRTTWALDILAECGFRYDSSIFPIRVRGYGIAGWPQGIHRIRTEGGHSILEVPVATGSAFSQRIPVGGGGYLRLLPGRVIMSQLRQMQDQNQPAVIYCHPHEFDPSAFRDLPMRVPLLQRLHQGLGRRSFESKMEAILGEMKFGSLSDLIARVEPS